MIEIIPNWHPIFVHFTVALLSLSAVFFVIQRPLAETLIGDNFLIIARYSLWSGVLISLATIVAGWDAYNSVNHDDLSHAAMTEHRNWGLATFALFAFLGLWWKIVSGIDEKASLLFIFCLLIGAGLLGSTTYKGSQLVFKFGLGVQSLPAKDDHTAGGDHGHAHGHGNEPAGHHDAKASKDSNSDPDKAHSHDSISESDHHLSRHESIEHSHDAINTEEVNVELHKAEPDVSSVNDTPSDATLITKPLIKMPLKVADEPKVISAPEVVSKPKTENKPKVADEPKIISAPEVVNKPKVENKPKAINPAETEVKNNTIAVEASEPETTDEAITDEAITDEAITDEDNTFLIH